MFPHINISLQIKMARSSFIPGIILWSALFGLCCGADTAWPLQFYSNNNMVHYEKSPTPRYSLDKSKLSIETRGEFWTYPQIKTKKSGHITTSVLKEQGILESNSTIPKAQENPSLKYMLDMHGLNDNDKPQQNSGGMRLKRSLGHKSSILGADALSQDVNITTSTPQTKSIKTLPDNNEVGHGDLSSLATPLIDNTSYSETPFPAVTVNISRIQESGNNSDRNSSMSDSEGMNPLLLKIEAIGPHINRVVIITILIVGTFGNIVSLCVMLRASLRETSTCTYTACLAVADLLYLWSWLLPATVEELSGGSIQMMNWLCGKLWFFGFYAFGNISVYILTAMTVDRFIIVHFPLKASFLCTPRRSLIVCGLITLVFMIYDSFLLIYMDGWVSSGLNMIHPKFTTKGAENFYFKIFDPVDGITYCGIPIFLLAFLNILIVRKIIQLRNRMFKTTTYGVELPTVSGAGLNSNGKRSAAAQIGNLSIPNPLPEEQNPESPITIQQHNAARLRQDHRLTILCITVCSTFIILSMPFAGVYAYLFRVGKDAYSTREETILLNFGIMISELFSHMNHAINFFLYCLSGRKFRKELVCLLKKLFGCCPRKTKQNLSRDQDTTGTNFNGDSANSP